MTPAFQSPRPLPPTPPPLLTSREKEVLERLGGIWEDLTLIVGNGPTREADLAELRIHVHAIQQAVLSQAGARGYPDHFRLLGERFPR